MAEREEPMGDFERAIQSAKAGGKHSLEDLYAKPRALRAAVGKFLESSQAFWESDRAKQASTMERAFYSQFDTSLKIQNSLPGSKEFEELTYRALEMVPPAWPHVEPDLRLFLKEKAQVLRLKSLMKYIAHSLSEKGFVTDYCPSYRNAGFTIQHRVKSSKYLLDVKLEAFHFHGKITVSKPRSCGGKEFSIDRDLQLIGFPMFAEEVPDDFKYIEEIFEAWKSKDSTSYLAPEDKELADSVVRYVIDNCESESWMTQLATYLTEKGFATTVSAVKISLDLNCDKLVSLGTPVFRSAVLTWENNFHHWHAGCKWQWNLTCQSGSRDRFVKEHIYTNEDVINEDVFKTILSFIKECIAQEVKHMLEEM